MHEREFREDKSSFCLLNLSKAHLDTSPSHALDFFSFLSSNLCLTHNSLSNEPGRPCSTNCCQTTSALLPLAILNITSLQHPHSTKLWELNRVFLSCLLRELKSSCLRQPLFLPLDPSTYSRLLTAFSFNAPIH